MLLHPCGRGNCTRDDPTCGRGYCTREIKDSVDSVHCDEYFLTAALEALVLEGWQGEDGTAIGSEVANVTEIRKYPIGHYEDDEDETAVAKVRPKPNEHPVCHCAGAVSDSVNGPSDDDNECGVRTGQHSYVTVCEANEHDSDKPRTALMTRSNDPGNKACPWKSNVLVQRGLADIAEDTVCMHRLKIYIDSGCSNHMSPNGSFLSDYVVKFKPGGVVFGSETAGKADIMGYGFVWELRHVAHVPSLSVMLISEAVLDREGHTIVKDQGICTVRYGSLKIMSFTLRKNNLYELDDEYKRVLCDSYCYYCTSKDPDSKFVKRVYEIRSDDHRGPSAAGTAPYTYDTEEEDEGIIQDYEAEIVDSNPNDGVRVSKRKLFDPKSSEKDRIFGSSRKKGKMVLGTSNPIEILHNRFGHWNVGQIKKLVRDKLAIGIGYTYDQIANLELGFCTGCMQGKMRAETPKPVDNVHNWQNGEWWSFDIKQSPWKSSKTKYFVLFVDRRSRYKKVYLMRRKDALPDIIKMHNSSVKIDGYTWKLAMCDSENVNLSQDTRDYLESEKIQLRRSAPYEHSQNGLAESNIGRIMDTTRTQMISGRVPDRFWTYALFNAVYVANRMYNRAVSKTPFHAYTGEIPDVSNMVPFYAPGVCYITKEERNANKELYNFKGRLVRMLGYDDEGKNSYIVRDVIRNTIMVRKGCVFNENVSPEVVRSIMREYEAADTLRRKKRASDELSDSEETPMRVTRAMTKQSVLVDEMKLPAKGSSDMSVDTSDEGETSGESISDIDDSEDMSLDLALAYLARKGLKVGGTDRMAKRYIDKDLDEGDFDVAMYHYANSIREEVTTMALPPNPKTLSEAVSLSNPYKDQWIEAVRKELRQMEDRESFEEAEEQTGRGMKTKLIYRVSYDNEYKLKFKARLVMCGYSQIKGLDYLETYAPTPAISTIFMLAHIAKVRRYTMASFDVSGAFLEGKNDFEMYCYLPKELGLSRNRFKVLNSVYGEKQAGKIWYDLNDNILTMRLGFTRCTANPNLYYRTKDNKTVYTVIHVDDTYMAGTTESAIDDFVAEYQVHVRGITYFGTDVKKFVGIEFEEDEDYVYLTQKDYIASLVKDRVAPKRPVHTPMMETINLRSAEKNPENESLLPDTGKLRFLADRTRIDLMNVVGEIANGGDKEPSDAHLATRDRIYDYLHCYPNRRLRLGGRGPIKMFGFVDASFGLKSRLGGALFLGLDSGAFHAFSVSDRSTSLSTCEVEIKGIMRLVLPIIHFRDMLEVMGETQQEATDIYCDNESAVEICRVLKMTTKTRHIQKTINFIREQINARVINLKFVPGKLNPADVLTKPLSREPFHRHTTTLLEGFNGRLDLELNRAYLTLSELSELDTHDVSERIRVHNTMCC